MDIKSILMMVIWLAAVGAVIVFAARAITTLQGKAGL